VNEMKRNNFEVTDPYNLENESYAVYITIRDPFVNIVGAKGIKGRVVKIKLITGPDEVKWIPNGNSIGIWTKGRPADIEFIQVPQEFKMIDLAHIEKILIDVHGFG
jgi:hypothetical protein